MGTLENQGDGTCMNMGKATELKQKVSHPTKAVGSIADYLVELKKIQENHENYTFAYREHYLKEWKIIPKIGRKDFKDEYQEMQMDLQFKKGYASLYERRSYIPTKKMDWLFLEQHYGIPTRLLDWTLNPLVALFFACYDDNIKKNCNGQVIVFPIKKQSLKEEEKDINPFDSNEIKEMQKQFIIPNYFDQRMRNQQAAFTITSTPKVETNNPELKRIDIRAKSKKSILNELENLSITLDFIYPTLDRMCERIKNEFLK